MNSHARPIWFRNISIMRRRCGRHDHQLTLDLLLVMLPNINKWLDGTMVSGNHTARRVVRVVFSMMRRIADFSMIAKGCWTKTLYLRLRGLC
jgi:hypothetical protein